MDVTGLVVTAVDALVTPAGTVMVAGTVTAAVLLLDSATTAPAAGATELSVTVAEALLPPCTLAGLRPTELRAGEEGGAVTVQPDSRTLTAVAEPSFTSTVQSAGGVYPDRSILKDPELLLVVIWTPSTVIGRLAVALPSIRSLVPLTSARATLTAACADPARLTSRTATTANATATRKLRPVMTASWAPRDAQLLIRNRSGCR